MEINGWSCCNTHSPSLLSDLPRCFLVSIHQTRIVFLEASFSSEYLDYICSSVRTSNPPYVTILRTKEYDLAIPQERVAAAQALVSLVLWFEELEHENDHAPE